MAVLNNSALVGAAGKGGGAAALPQRSLRFNSADSAYLSRNFSSGNQKTWTWSAWVKVSALSTTSVLFGVTTGTSDSTWNTIRFVNGNLRFNVWTTEYRISSAVFRDFSAWYHIVVALNTPAAAADDRVKIYVNGTQITTFDTNNAISQNADLPINSAVAHTIGASTSTSQYFSGYLANIHFIDGQALDPSAFAYTDPVTGRWEPKAYAGSYSGNSFYLDFSDNSAATAAALGKDRSGLNNDWLPTNFSVINGNGNYNGLISATGTTYGSIPEIFDGNTATAFAVQSGTLTYAPSPSTSVSSSIKFWYSTDQSNTRFRVNGGSYITLSDPAGVGTYTHSFSGTLTSIEWNAPTSNELIAVHQIQIDNLVLANYSAGAGNDSLRDHPVSAGVDTGLGGQVSGNHCTFNPLNSTSSYLSNGNLTFIVTSGIGWQNMNGTFGVSSGKWYCEITATAKGNTLYGITRNPVSTGFTAGDGYFIDTFGNAYGGMGTPNSTVSNGDVIGYALNLDTNSFTLYKNNSLLCTASISAGTYFVYLGGYYNYGNIEAHANFGARPFAFPAPAGFKCLCDQNLPTPPIIKPADYFDITTWVGTSDTNSTRSFSPFSFSPAFVWIKDRKDANQHTLYDAVRGPSNGTTSKALMTNSQNAEGTLNDDSTYGYLSSFDANGFSVWRGNDGAYVDRNTNGYVAWAWNAGGQPTTDNVAGAGNVPTAGSVKINGANMTTALAGSIPATRLSANTAAGFSVVSWTGGTAGTLAHGLNAAPGLVITKSRTSTVAWRIWHSSFSSLANYIGFDTGSTGTFPSGNYWQAFTSSTIGFTGGYDNNTGNMIAYCFAPVAGYSAFGVYSGGTVGTFVHLGFTPKFLLVHSATGSIGDAWKAYDSTRSPYNARADFIAPNAADAEVPNNLNQFDFVSNGFVVRSNTIYDTNFSNHTYLYCAFAESPFRYSRAR